MRVRIKPVGPVLGAVAVTSSLALLGLAAPASAQQKGQLEEVIVTAQKRAQSLEDTPIAISAFDSQSIERLGIEDVQDVGHLAPNVSITETPSNATGATIGIRGSVTINPAPYWEPTVGMYINGVFVGKNLGGIFDLIELERVEVLRGPQGTLYGKNTVGGAVNLITTKPSGQFGGKVRVGVGNYGLWSVYTAVDTPSLDLGLGKISASVAGMRKKRDDLYDNKADPLGNPFGLNSPAPSASGFKNIDSHGFRASVLWDVNDDLSALYEYRYHNADQHPPLSQLTDVQPGGPTDPILNGYLVSADHRASQISNDHAFFEKAESRANALHIDWHAGQLGFLGDVTFKSITSYQTLDTSDSQDLDGSPIDLFHFGRYFDYKQTSQEFQMLGTTDITNYVLGLYYFKEKGDVINPITFFGAFGQPTLQQYYGLDNDSYAVYGQIDVRPLDRLTLTFGARYTSENKKQYIWHPDSGIPYTKADKGWTNFTPTFTASYSFMDNVNGYFRIARGWKSGGFNSEAVTTQIFAKAYNPEKVTSYELGLKSRLFDNRLQLNTAVFYNKVEDMQLSIFTGGASAASIIENAGKATIWGFELEMVGQVTDNLRAFLNYGYLHPRYDEFLNASGQDVRSDQYFAYSPENTIAAGLDWTILEESFGKLDFHADWSFKDNYTPYIDPAQREVTKISGYYLVNAKLTLSEIPVGDDQKLQVSLWGKNLTDEEYRVTGIPFGPWTISNFGDPRTYGVEVTYEF